MRGMLGLSMRPATAAQLTGVSIVKSRGVVMAATYNGKNATYQGKSTGYKFTRVTNNV